MQMLTPCLLFQSKPSCKLTIEGGTHVNFSPTQFPVEHVLLPVLAQMGANIELNLLKYGFYPDVKGKVEITVSTLQAPLRAICLTERGSQTPSKLVIRVKPADAAS